MNRIYNVIWSKTKKCYVVVSEIVKTGGGKVKSVQNGTTWARMSAIMAVATLLMAGNITTVNADSLIIDGTYNGYATAHTAGTWNSTLFNYQNPGNDKPLDNSQTTQNGYPLYTGKPIYGLSIGRNTNIVEPNNTASYSGVAIGDNTVATGGISFALGNYAQATNASSMAIGTATLSSGFNSLAMMRQSAARGDFSTAIGTASWANGNGSFAMGYSATAKGDQSIAIGAAETITIPGNANMGGTPSAKYNGDGNTVTEGARSLAFGTKARTAVGADDSMAFGSSSSTGGANAVAMGYSANASAENAFAIGNTAQSSAQNAVAMGKSANASGVSSFAMGSSSNAAGADAIAMGSSSQAKLSNSIALGGNAKSLGADALALGGAANASKDGAIAIGKEAKANNTNTTAIGLGATVTGTNSMAIGTNAVAESNNSLALGTGTEVRGALVNGYSAFTNQQNNNVANGVVAVGNVGSERRIINVAGGENDTDATNVKQLKFVNSNLAKSIAGPTYTGYEANGSTYKAPDFNIKNSTYHTVKEAVEAAQTNFFSAKGTSADANYDNTGATGNNATAAGVRTSAAGNFATAVGADATAANTNSTAIGYKAKSSVDDGVALGANSVASVASGKAGYNVKTADSRTNGYSGLTGAALTSTMGAVSVGDGGTKTRQITNVAAGTADTDAVNVAQLRNVNLKVAGNTGKNDVLLDNQTLTVKGDGSYVTTSVNNQTIDVALTDATKNKIDNAANKDLSNITDNGKSVIRDEAQKAVKVVAGKNTTITEGTDGTYKTYKVDVDAPDYQLTENSGAADKAYTVSGNKVDLTVQDAKNPANKKTVTIKDIASKTELDATKTELINKGLKFDADNGGEKTNKLGSKVTVAGDGTNINTTITQTGDDTTIKVALGQDINVNTVTATKTVKAGTATMGTQSVTDNKSAAQNGNFVSGLDNKNWTLTDPAYVSGRAATEDQLKIVSDAVKAANASASDYRLIANPNNAADGSYKVDNNKVDLQVKDDKSGTVNTVTIKDIASKTELDKVKDRSVKYDGNTGHDTVTLEGANGTKITNLKDGNVAAGSKDAVNGGQLHQVKQDLGDQITNTKNDLNNKIDNTKTDLINKGLRFNADNDDEKTNKLGSKVTVNGDDNITTEITQTGDDTKIALKLKKDLNVRSVTATDTVKAGDVTMGKQADGANPGNTGNYITGLDNKTWDPGNVVSGRAATEDQLKQALANQTATGLKFDANVGGVQTSKLGSTVIVKGEGKAADTDYSGENIKTFIKQDAATGNTTIDVKMSKNLKAESVTVAKDGKNGVSITGPDTANGTDGKVGITDKDGKEAVSMSGKDGVGHIGLSGKDGKSADITAEKGDPDIEGNVITRIKYQDENGKTHQVATKDDGMKYGGDSGAVINKKLNEQVNVIGGITDASKLTTEDNLGVVSDGSNNLKVRMAKDLKGLETVTTKDAAGNTTVVNGGGMKITPASGNPVSLTKDGLDNGGNKITNVAKGTAPTDAVNKSQLDQAAAAATTTVTAGDNIKVTSSDNPNGSKNYEVSLKDQVTLGSDPKKQIAIDGNAGTIKAGDKIEIDGNKGTINVGKAGQDGVSITGPDTANGTDGKVGIAGKDGKDAVSMSGKDGVGHIGLNGKDGRSADISVEKGAPDLDGNEITRIKYQDENGKTHQVATKDDGMKYGGDSGAVINKKLNEQVNVIGGITDASKLTTEDNLGVVSDGTGNLKVRMAKDLKGLETVTTKDAAGNTTVMNGGGVTITPASGNAVSLTKDGLNNGGNTITNVAAGVNGTDAVNVNQLKGATDKMENAINAVAGETQRVGAHAAAISALKPIQYDPLEPTQVMAGIGNYRGETAAALGVAHYTAEDTMFHVGVSVGSHHNMVNAGVTHKFGNSDAKKAIPDRYKGGPISSVYVLQDEVTALKAENARMQESLNELSSVKADNEQMKAQIALLMQQAGLTK